MSHDVFISYSNKNEELTKSMVEFLENHSIKCFAAYRDIPKGADWADYIPPAIENSKLMVLVFSESTNTSKQVKKELGLCDTYDVGIIPFRVIDTTYKRSFAYFLNGKNWIDAFPNPHDHFVTLLNAVYSNIGKDTKVFIPNDYESNDNVAVDNPKVLTVGSSLNMRLFCDNRTDKEIDNVKNIDVVLRNGCKYYELVMDCPICLEIGKINSPMYKSSNFWVHSDKECNGKIYVGDDGMCCCSKCCLSSHIQNWHFGCENHSFPDRIEYCLPKAVSIISQLSTSTNFLLRVKIDWFNKFSSTLQGK